jgi:predicted Rossmann-fold nucleotide-binding protein
VVYYTPKQASRFEGQAGKNIADIVDKETNYLERTQRLLELGDAYVIFNGGTGTVSEFAMAWAVARLYFGKHKPLIFYGAFWKDILDTFWKNMKVREEAYKVFKYATTPEHVIQHLEHFEKMYRRYQNLPHEECEGDECELFLLPHEHKRKSK